MPRISGFLLVLGIVTGVGCGGKTPAPSPADRDQAVTFLKQIRDGQVVDAWNSTATEFKSFMGQAEFAKYVKQHPALKLAADPQDVELKVDQIPPLTLCRFRSSGPKPATIVVTLCYEDRAWKVGKLTVE
jgi:hypothetical protein